jgi:flagellar biosynthetic protein FliR
MIEANLLVFARCLGFIVRAPGFSDQSVPVPVRVGLALVLAIGLSPAIPAGAGEHGVGLVPALALECLLGGLIGFAANALYEGAAAGGKMLDDYVGIQVVNPLVNDTAGEGFGKLWGMGFLALFFIANGYQYLITVLAESLTKVPPGMVVEIHHLAQFATVFPLVVVKAALLVAAPALMVGFVMQFALGSVSRVIPRFANFTLAFPVVFGAVLIVTIVTFPYIVPTAMKPWLYTPFLER